LPAWTEIPSIRCQLAMLTRLLTSSHIVYKTCRNGWVSVGWVWISARHRCCGSALDRLSTDSQSKTQVLLLSSWLSRDSQSTTYNSQLCTRPRRRHWLSADNGWPLRASLSMCVLSTWTDSTWPVNVHFRLVN